MKAILLSLTCSVMLAVAQVLWKLGVNQHRLSMKWNDITQFIFSGYFLGGAFLYLFATAFWIYLLNKYPLSYIYPMIAFAYAVGAILAMTVLKEQISFLRWSGIFLVVVGVAVIGVNR